MFKKKKTLNPSMFSLLRTSTPPCEPVHIILLAAGLEPARCCHRGILSPLRLPIPPHQRVVAPNTCRERPASDANGWRWIRTTEAICSRFTVCPLWPLGNPSMQVTLTIKNCSICLHKMQDTFTLSFRSFIHREPVFPVS